jgi:DNA-binding CsgD family transcriptional regulator
VLASLAWARILHGRPVDDLLDRFHAATADPAYLYHSVDRPVAVRLAWRGDVAGARTALGALLKTADERGEAVAYVAARLNLCELHLRAGDCEPAARLLDEWGESGDGDLIIGPQYERCRALLAATRGLHEDVEGWAEQALAGADAAGIVWDHLEALRARGLAALRAGNPARALESLRPVWAHTQRAGVDDPGAFPVAPDLVDALVETGERDEALAVIGRLTLLARQQAHPWAQTTAKRCAAVLALAGAYDAAAATALDEAASEYEELGLRFDAARSRLSLGRTLRRFKKWGAARTALERAAAMFDELGAPGWAEQARAELARVGARRPAASGDLTPTEGRVVGLAVEGRSNKEIARILFVTVHTVEVHLSHAYAKLGVRSRTQLAGRLAVQT